MFRRSRRKSVDLVLNQDPNLHLQLKKSSLQQDHKNIIHVSNAMNRSSHSHSNMTSSNPSTKVNGSTNSENSGSVKKHTQDRKRRRSKKEENTTEGVKSSLNAKSPSKGLASRPYEKKSKRFTWPEELHRVFVASIFDVGLKHASPKTLLSLMGESAVTCGLTTEHLKSHLQKYRQNYDRSRAQFIQLYEESLREGVDYKTKKKEQENKYQSDEISQQHGVFPVCMRGMKGLESAPSSPPEHRTEPEPLVTSTSTCTSTTATPAQSEDQPLHHSLPTSNESTRTPTPPMYHTKIPVATPTFYAMPHPNVDIGLQYQVAKQAQQTDMWQKYQFALEQKLAEHRIQSEKLQVELAAFRGFASAHVPQPTHNTQQQPTSHPQAMYTSTQRDGRGSTSRSSSPPLLHEHGRDSPLDHLKDNTSTMRSQHESSRSSTSVSSSTSSSNKPPATLSGDPCPVDPFMASLDSFVDLNNTFNKPPNNQLEMHMAMQSQMNLHRQILLRKSEVSKHAYVPTARNNEPTANIATAEPKSDSSESNKTLSNASTSNLFEGTDVVDIFGSNPAESAVQAFESVEWEDKLNLDVNLNDDDELFSFLKA